jgi:hypothetical protein
LGHLILNQTPSVLEQDPYENGADPHGSGATLPIIFPCIL